MCVANTRVPAAGTLARMERFQPCSLSAARCEFLPSTHQVFWPRNFARDILSRHSLSLEKPFDHTPAFPIPLFVDAGASEDYGHSASQWSYQQLAQDPAVGGQGRLESYDFE
jgi:hypothetical protein